MRVRIILTSSVIEGAAASGNDGRICAENSELRVEDSAIRSNRARYHGGGIYAYRSSVILSSSAPTSEAAPQPSQARSMLTASSSPRASTYIAESRRPHQLVSGTIAANGLAGLVMRETGAYLRHVLIKRNGTYGVKVSQRTAEPRDDPQPSSWPLRRRLQRQRSGRGCAKTS